MRKAIGKGNNAVVTIVIVTYKHFIDLTILDIPLNVDFFEHQVQMSVQSMIFNQGMLQQQQQQGQPQRIPQQFYPRGMQTRPLRIPHQHPQATNQPAMYQSPPGVGVQQVIQMPAGGPQYTISPQQYAVPQVSYVKEQEMNEFPVHAGNLHL
jgi:hypothetical protein